MATTPPDTTGREPHFFKVLLGDFKRRLKIPPKFMKHISNETSKKVILRGPNGSSWQVGINKSTNGNFLSSGWSNFAEDHSLKEQEFLIFRYDGNMHFNVMIFDTTACEREDVFEMKTGKKSACEGRNKECRPRKRSFEDSCILQQSSSRSKLQKPLSNIKHTSKQLNGNRVKFNTELHVSPTKISNRKITTGDAELPFYKPLLQTFFVPSRRPVTLEEQALAEEAANSFHSPFPYTIIRMKKDHGVKIHKLRLPSRFSRMLLPYRRPSYVLRDPSGIDWTVAYTPSKRSLCKGWSAFARGNRIEEGDFCAFELIGDLELRVHIFRVVEEITLLAKSTVKSA